MDQLSNMNMLSNDYINILDLPDEMLRVIFNKLNMVDVFYSLVDVNQRFDRLALDSLYIRHLDFVVKPLPKYGCSSVDHQVLDTICSKILPRIQHKINKLTLEPLSMERVLGATHYPQLHSLSLVNVRAETLLQHLTDDAILRRLLTDQITQLKVDTYVEKAETSDGNELNVFPMVLSICKRLCDLTFNQCILDENLLVSIFNLPTTSCVSSTLTKLNINVNTFDDCLYLLDGRLECLSTLIIHIREITESSLNKDNTKKLSKLKCFSLTSIWYTCFYDNQIVPLLRRMLNLEELTLFLAVIRMESTYIDGKQLYDEVLIHMPRLKKFIFSIHSYLINYDIRIDLPSNNDIRSSFVERGYQQIDSFADDKLTNNRANCHIYSLPYQFEKFVYLTSSFQGGQFDKVKSLVMCDRHPFEHEFFKIISRDFPFLQILIITNVESQRNKQPSSTFITFNHLWDLSLKYVHIDYAVQFLFGRNIRLPRLTNLSIGYETLATVTNNFTNDATRLTCSKIKCLDTYGPLVSPENFHLYFPLL